MRPEGKGGARMTRLEADPERGREGPPGNGVSSKRCIPWVPSVREKAGPSMKTSKGRLVAHGRGSDLILARVMIPGWCGIEPCVGLCAQHGDCLGFSLSLSLPLPLTPAHALSKKKKKKKKMLTISGCARQSSLPGRGPSVWPYRWQARDTVLVLSSRGVAEAWRERLPSDFSKLLSGPACSTRSVSDLTEWPAFYLGARPEMCPGIREQESAEVRNSLELGRTTIRPSLLPLFCCSPVSLSHPRGSDPPGTRPPHAPSPTHDDTSRLQSPTGPSLALRTSGPAGAKAHLWSIGIRRAEGHGPEHAEPQVGLLGPTGRDSEAAVGLSPT
ncbi:uncharacterized protein LOC109495344 [Felis catus]|uniref:uncharacterized protein LOC109495344 n=1 Tax=Felis catus TaxID=9685 RepID=UPI001D19E6E8|nr:uncharacterized protein LOC109495344 [Felis catus]XP_044903901.1 uncharacterized protein LOC109495344 [Felis catus]